MFVLFILYGSVVINGLFRGRWSLLGVFGNRGLQWVLVATGLVSFIRACQQRAQALSKLEKFQVSAKWDPRAWTLESHICSE